MNKKFCLGIIAILFTSLLSFFVAQKSDKVFAEEEICELKSGEIITKYDSVYSALNVASQMGGTVKLLKDVSEDVWLNNITIASNMDVSFDLNGYTYNEKVVEEKFKRIILEGTFTLKDSSLLKTGKWNYLNNDSIDFDNKFKLSSTSNNIRLNIEGGYISNYASFIDAYSCKNAVINISGGLFDAQLFNSISNEVTLNVTGGKFIYDPYITQIGEKGIFNVNISGMIDGLKLCCTQTNLANKKYRITVADDISIKENKIVFQLFHNIHTDMDGLIVASFDGKVINKDPSVFNLKIIDTTTSIVKETEDNWKLVVIGDNLVIKSKDYFDNSIPNVSNKLVINNSNGDKLTFSSSYKGDLSKYEDSILVVNHLRINNHYQDIASSLELKNYSVIDVVEISLLKDSIELECNFEDTFYISLRLDEMNANFDNYLVIDEDKNIYSSTVKDNLISFKTNTIKKYLVLVKGIQETSYLLGAIIPLSTILLFEIGFIAVYYLKKRKKVKSLSVALFAIWPGAVPIIIIEAILIIVFGGYIAYLLIFKKKKDDESKDE